MQPGEIHVDEEACRCTGFRMLFIEPTLLLPTARELGLSRAPRFRIPLSGDAKLLTAVAGLCAAVEQRAPAAEQQSHLTACMRRMLDLMIEPPSPEHSVHRPVIRARDHLKQRFQETVTLDDLVEVASLSRYHLLRSFSAHVGLPPHAYQMRLRIERAMALLRSGLPAGTVAGLAGFADQSHLTRNFRRLLRVTPAEYARAGAQ
jgi:transcriptional regulator GlxA family with amidase domain